MPFFLTEIYIESKLLYNEWKKCSTKSNNNLACLVGNYFNCQLCKLLCAKTSKSYGRFFGT